MKAQTLIEAMKAAIAAPTDQQSARAVELADRVTSELDQDAVERACHRALKYAEIPAAFNEAGFPIHRPDFLNLIARVRRLGGIRGRPPLGVPLRGAADEKR